MIDRQIERESVAFCRKFDIALMCWGPLAGGILTGKYHGPGGIPEGSRASTLGGYLIPHIEDETVKATVRELGAIANELGLGMNQTAILWLKAKPCATTIILGGSRPEHFTQIYDVADAELPAEAVDRLDAISAPRVYTPFMNQPIENGPGLSGTR